MIDAWIGQCSRQWRDG
jgi:hypothetical protein